MFGRGEVATYGLGFYISFQGTQDQQSHGTLPSTGIHARLPKGGIKLADFMSPVKARHKKMR